MRVNKDSNYVKEIGNDKRESKSKVGSIIVRGRGYVAAAPPVNRQSRIPPPTKPSGRPQLTTLTFQLR